MRHGINSTNHQAAVRLSQILGAALRHSALPAHVARRDGSARLGFLRHRPRHRRRLYRPPQLRHGPDRPPARSAGFPGRHHQPAGLEFCCRLQEAGQAQSFLRRHRRQHGFDGQPLHLGPQDPLRRCLHARRRAKQASGPRRHRLCPALPRGLSRQQCRDRLDRGQPAPYRPLRLLVGQGAAFGAARLQGRHAGLRQCRARHCRTGTPPGQGRQDRRNSRSAWYRFHGTQRLAAGR